MLGITDLELSSVFLNYSQELAPLEVEHLVLVQVGV